ncbi:hypothetical protein CN330_27515 [Priestia megaterium]|uniref:hypothetical protein n=1 Tax=Priestia megaterium TaxID=1404 RepID=UPI000BF42CA5|nr:hypothetical protein [Priestia megaterium]PEZ06120.1 hypothetical protein CN330_27515 [Priestia megaterium]
MIPSVDLKDGKKLTLSEAKEFFETNIKTNADFTTIVEEINKFGRFSEDKIEFIAANKVELASEDVDTDTALATRIVLQSGKSLVSYQLTEKGKNLKHDIMGAVLNENNNKLISIIIEQGHIVNTAYEYDGELEQDFEEGLPDNENFKEGQSLSAVEAQYKWGDGCYPLYKHCGRNCGDNGDYGGGTPKNPYDTCCRTHDRCWAAYGTNNCGCDCALISCAKKNWVYAPAALHIVLLAYFPVKDSCKC